MLEAERVADLVRSGRAQVLDVALAGADLREHVDDGVVEHLAAVRADSVGLVIVETELRRPAADHGGDERTVLRQAVDDVDRERCVLLAHARHDRVPRAVAAAESWDPHAFVCDVTMALEEHGDVGVRLRRSDGEEQHN